MITLPNPRKQLADSPFLAISTDCFHYGQEQSSFPMKGLDLPMHLCMKQRNFFDSPAVPSAPSVLSIAGAQDGLGKTYVTTALGAALARTGKKVLLLDVHPGPADLTSVLGLRTEYSPTDFFSGERALAELVVKGPSGLHLLCLGGELESQDALQRKLRLREGIETLHGRYDLVLIDTEAGPSHGALFFHAAAQEILLITMPEPAAIAATSFMLRTLSARYHKKSFHLLVNRARNEADALDVYRRLTMAATLDMDISLNYLGFLYQDSTYAAIPRPGVVGKRRGRVLDQLNDTAERLHEILKTPRSGGTYQFFWEQNLQAGCCSATLSSF